MKEAKVDGGNSALQYLWTRNQIAVLDDYNHISFNEERKKQVIDLGLKYNLLTAYTSFVAIDDNVRNQSGEMVTVKQPLPLPQGVSNLAVGGSVAYSYSSNMPSIVTRGGTKGYNEKSKKDRSGKSGEIFSMDVDETAVAEEESFAIIEKMPEFPGGEKALMEFIKNHIVYPEEERLNGTECIVYVSFIVDKYGDIKSIKVLRGISESLDKEALRVIKLMPKWTPGERAGSRVDVNFPLPIKFALSKK